MIKRGQSVSTVRWIYVITTIFMIGLSLITFLQISNLYKSSNLIHQTNQVQNALQEISNYMMEAESKKRGYLLTADSVLLLERDEALHSLELAQHKLDSLISGNAAQMAYASLLHKAIEENKKSIMEAAVPQSQWNVPVHLKITIHEALQRIDNVNNFLEKMTKEETTVLEQRTHEYTQLSLIAPFYVIVLFLGALLILFFSYFKLNKALIKSQNMHAALIMQDEDKEALAEKLILANQELAYRNEEKENRARELAVANVELEFQNKTKEILAAELIVANQELAFQNEEKEKRASELVAANRELQLFLNISSHDLQEPLRKIQMAASRIEESDYKAVSAKGQIHLVKMKEAAISMQTLIEDLLTYSRTNSEERTFENIDLGAIISEVRNDLREIIEEKNAIIEVKEVCMAHIIRFQFRQLIHNMISNALKFSIPGKPPHIQISATIKLGNDCSNTKLKQDQEYCHIQISDNGIGFEPEYNEKIFEVFQRLYGKETYEGTGIGLAIVKRIVENHDGCIIAQGALNKGAIFDIYIPTIKKA